MDEEEKGKSSFKVEDRRRFSAEGELKPEFQRDEPTASAGQAPPTEAEAPSPTRPAAEPKFEGPSFAEPNFTEVGGDPSIGADEGEMSFAAFLVGISTQALVHLGEIVDPQGGLAEVNLAAAQQLIDIVGMLRDKTRGNLDKDEEGLLESILFELRMKFVERSRNG